MEKRMQKVISMLILICIMSFFSACSSGEESSEYKLSENIVVYQQNLKAPFPAEVSEKLFLKEQKEHITTILGDSVVLVEDGFMEYSRDISEENGSFTLTKENVKVETITMLKLMGIMPEENNYVIEFEPENLSPGAHSDTIRIIFICIFDEYKVFSNDNSNELGISVYYDEYGLKSLTYKWINIDRSKEKENHVLSRKELDDIFIGYVGDSYLDQREKLYTSYVFVVMNGIVIRTKLYSDTVDRVNAVAVNIETGEIILP